MLQYQFLRLRLTRFTARQRMVWLLFVAMFMQVGCATATGWERFEYDQPKMGMAYRIVLYAEDAATADRAAQAAYARVDELIDILSDYEVDSELSRLSRLTHGEVPTSWVDVSEDLFRVLDAAALMSQQSDGAFDVTVGPYVRLWRRSHRQHALPAERHLIAARNAVGFEKIELDPHRRQVRLTAPDMLLDLGGIAKGYILDETLVTLQRQGIRSALVDAGGDVVVGDAPPVNVNAGDDAHRRGWRLALVAMDQPDKTTGEYVRLENAAIATSGDTYRYVEIDGKRYSHLIDPKTGLGLTERIGVTVFAPTGMQADAMASAVSVLGAQKGMELLQRFPAVEGRIMTVKDGQVRKLETADFSAKIE